MNKNKKDAAWENCNECDCGDNDCHPKNHRMCGICGNQRNKYYYDRRIMYGSFGDRNSRYGWNIDHKKPKAKGGTDKNSNLRATHIECNEKRKDN